MTLETQSTKSVAQGNNATTVWPYAFLVPAETDLIVTVVTISSGNETVIAPSNYTVTGIGDPAGGTVTYPLSGSPLSPLFEIVVQRFVPDVQETDLVNQGGAYPQDIEDALDYLTMITQQQQDQLDRAIVFSVADTVPNGTLPLASARANKFLGFGTDGSPIVVDVLTPGTTVSAAMIPVVTAPTTADALIALGLPGALFDTLIPAGTIWDYSLPTPPTGFVFPIGQACTNVYPVLRAALVAAGSPYGTNGIDPLLPDLRSAVIAGKSNMGGVDNGLLTGGTVLGALLGNQNRVLITSNLPPYTPTGTVGITDPGHTHTNNATVSSGLTAASSGGAVVGTDVSPPTFATINAAVTGVTAAFTGAAQGGTSTAFSIVQPTFICNKIIKVH